MAIQSKDFDAANRRAALRTARSVKAVSAKYDRRIGMVVVRLSSGLFLQFRPREIQGLERARPGDFSMIVVSPSGLGLHVPKLDADVSVPGLLRGLVGSRAWMQSLAKRGE